MRSPVRPVAVKILALDTALAACSAAVAIDGEVAARRHDILHRGHAEKIIPMTQRVCADAGLAPDALDLIAVTVGPGTFTGVRIGLAAARGLALPARTPVLGVTTLQALAWGVGSGRPVLAAIDARRGEVYLQAFDADLLPMAEPLVCTPDVAARHLRDGDTVAVGSGAALIADRVAGLRLAAAAAEPDAAVMAIAAAAHTDRAVSGRPPAPLYLRAPDAKLPS